MALTLSRGVNVFDLVCVPKQVICLAATRWGVSVGAFRSTFIGADPQSPSGMEWDLELSMHVRAFVTGWHCDDSAFRPLESIHQQSVPKVLATL